MEWKEYERNKNNKLVFDGEYLNGKRWRGKGVEYDIYNYRKLIFEGEYSKGKWIP